jgi:mono/diheme cytochrome c family protein
MFNDAQRAALRTTLKRMTILASPVSPPDQVRLAMVRFNCVACHARAGAGGPTPSRADYFTNLTRTDLGDEGRLPPHLNEAGWKLPPAWLREVLVNRGAVRPYLATRMPQFGAANIGPLVAAFAQADAGSHRSPPSPTSPRGEAAAGRLLVGTNGCACIACHNFGPFKSQGIAVMDMTRMAQRLNRDWFVLYLLDPQSLRPGTRMPAFWPDGKATVPTILEGNTDRQIQAIWSFLSQGGRALPPPGIDRSGR